MYRRLPYSSFDVGFRCAANVEPANKYLILFNMLFNRLHAGRHIALRLGNVYGRCAGSALIRPESAPVRRNNGMLRSSSCPSAADGSNPALGSR